MNATRLAVAALAVLALAAGTAAALPTDGTEGTTPEAGSSGDTAGLLPEPFDRLLDTLGRLFEVVVGTIDPDDARAADDPAMSDGSSTDSSMSDGSSTDSSMSATDVTVSTRIYAGNGTDGTVVREGRERVGRPEAGDACTTTERVSPSLSDGIAVQGADGWITVRTTVEYDGGTVTFTDRRQVA